MAKKKTAKRSPGAPESNSPDSKKTERDADRSPEVQQAAEAVSAAKTEFEKAQQLYHEVRQQATDRLRQVREKTVGDLIDDTLEVVKKHPGPGLVVAGVIGFLLGRLFGRLLRR